MTREEVVARAWLEYWDAAESAAEKHRAMKENRASAEDMRAYNEAARNRSWAVLRLIGLDAWDLDEE